MTTAEHSDARIPLVCADDSMVVGAEIFDPNSWSGVSKGIIQSCWTEYSVLHHCVAQITGMCNESEQLCQKHVETIQQQWRTKKFDLGKVVVYGPMPDLHLRIEAFFCGLKTLLDLLVQLLSSEKIVSGAVDGFHRAKGIYGGTVLNALENNVPNAKGETARKILALIYEHKSTWIDQAILARDQLIHPDRGIHQLMFQLDFKEQAGELVCERVNSPFINSEPIDHYAQRILAHAEAFSSQFIPLVREA